MIANGGRIDWSPAANLIVFDRLDADGYFDVYTMAPTGTEPSCLTCDRPGLPTRSMGNPAWHPSGKYIAFQGQNEFRGFGTITDYFANPGAGVNNDVWVMTADGSRFWRLTTVPVQQGGVLHPQFSRDGRQLLWSERLSSTGGKWGTWALRLADFTIDGAGTPRIQNVRTLQPGAQRQMYESHGFSPDGRQLLFSGNLEPGQLETGSDIYLYDVASGRLQNLTQTATEWDEHAHFSPDGRSIVWMTAKGQPTSGSLRTDYWIMNPDGSNKRRLTYFNDAKSAQFITGGVIAADSAWSPDGRSLAGYLITDVRKGGKVVLVLLPTGKPGPTAPLGLHVIR
jgi:Tol biopolymer transport system component